MGISDLRTFGFENGSERSGSHIDPGNPNVNPFLNRLCSCAITRLPLSNDIVRLERYRTSTFSSVGQPLVGFCS